jgi:glycosyltransferase involved in cell wall biosynthesis
VFIGLSEVAGIFSGLEAGLCDLGVDARFHNLSPNVLSYGGTSRRSYAGLLNLRHAAPGSVRNRVWRLALQLNRALRRVRAAVLFPWALLRYDRFVLGGHETFLGGPDLWLLRRLHKPTVIIFTGSDHRPPYLSGSAIRMNGSPRALAVEASRIRQRVSRAERWASAVVALPASAQFHRRPFVDFLKIGIAFDPPPRPGAAGLGQPHDDVRVLHCPTDPAAKGSSEIRRSVARSRERGLNVTLREITGRPNIEVLEAIQSCDFVIDELYSDTPMARFATEAAYYGKPAVVGSYAAATYRDGEGEGLPPSLLCHPDELDDAITTLATDATMRRDLGLRAQRFVTSQWTPMAVAERLLTLLNGAAPPDWIVDPREIRYVHGWGAPEATVRAAIRRMLDELGVDSLQLAQNSQVRKLAVDLAGGATTRTTS